MSLKEAEMVKSSGCFSVIYPFLFVGDIFRVDEAGTAPITASHLKASDMDTVLDKLVISLISPPQFGYIENVLPSPGFEKSNTGISIGKQ